MAASGLVAIGIALGLGIVGVDAFDKPAPVYEQIAGCVPESKAADANFSFRDEQKCLRHVPKEYARVVPISIETGKPIASAVFAWVPADEVWRQEAAWERRMASDSPLTMSPGLWWKSYRDQGVRTVVERRTF